MARTVKFKHFESDSPDNLMTDLQEWVNGDTVNVDWVAEFNVVVKGITWHAFIKYWELSE